MTREEISMSGFTRAILALAALASPAMAGTETFVSSSGSDASVNCSQAAPCATFSKAISVAGANGVVTCLDRGNYGTFNGTVSITTSLSILCGNRLGWAGATQFDINTTATDTVVLEGIVVDLQQQAGTPVSTSGAGALHVRNSSLRKSGSQVAGLDFGPTGAGALFVSDSEFDNNGLGIRIRPINSGFANVHLNNVKLENNSIGLSANGALSSTGINVNIVGGTATSNTSHGIEATSTTSSSAPVSVSVSGMQISGNLGAGVQARSLARATIKIGNSQITANATGVSAAGGQILSLGDNLVHSNGVNGAFTGAIPLQ